jgi:uncharacterized transporter YbjL
MSSPDFGPPPNLSDPLIVPPDIYPVSLPSPEAIIAQEENLEEETRRVVGEIVTEEVEAEDPVVELTDEERLLFRSLMTVGKRVKTLAVMDHSVLIETLNIDDELQIGLACREFEGTKAFARAYQLAVCAASVKEVDGIPLYQPLSEEVESSEVFAKKLDKLKKYYPVVLYKIYRGVLDLEQEFAELVEKLGKQQG